MDSKPPAPPQAAGIDIAEPSEQTQPIHGSDIAKILSSKGPIVKCVVLRAAKTSHLNDEEEEDSKPHAKPSISNGNKTGPSETTEATDQPRETMLAHDQQQQEDVKSYIHSELVEEILMDTTPSKNEVSRILGGPFTFLGQYEDEGIILMARQGWVEEDVTAAAPSPDHPGAWEEMSVSQLRSMCREQDICMDNMLEKNDLIVALTQKQKDLPPFNPHPLQPPFQDHRIRGDILVLKVAPVDDPLDDEEEDDDEEDDDEEDDGKVQETGQNHEGGDEDEKGEEASHEEEAQNAVSSSGGSLDESGADNGAKVNGNEIGNVNDNEKENEEDENDDSARGGQRVLHVPTNNEFFLDYTKAEYLMFACRTQAGGKEQGGEGEGENDGDYHWGEDMEEMTEEEEKSAMLNIVMSDLLRKFREDNGRGPETRELLDMRAAVAQQLGVEVTTFDDAYWEAEEARNAEQVAAAAAATAAAGEGASITRAAAGLGEGGDETLEDGPERKRVKFEKQLVTSEVHIDYSEEAAVPVHSQATAPLPLASVDDQQSFDLETSTGFPTLTNEVNSPPPSGLPKSDEP